MQRLPINEHVMSTSVHEISTILIFVVSILYCTGNELSCVHRDEAHTVPTVLVTYL